MWNFIWYHKNSEKNLARHSKSLSKPDVPFWNYRFLSVLCTVCYDFEKDFEWLSRFFFWIFVVPYKNPHVCNDKNTILLKVYPCFLSPITIYNFPLCPGYCFKCIKKYVTKPMESLLKLIVNKNTKKVTFLNKYRSLLISQ